ncbi:M16 family metallopeptidase [Aestuariibaculum lutulentum]|uniref:Insulinase family protein n=1 Tax=Aestuariibaculum lutulentum TaxID=2920935 RepID=A0ABS9RET7_9FLAO|nr:M16 family metallopeptidase [Aestuariibaculum lutulentum]MCH4551450.1 insulinase family protein [Aestuariibaculum lutulentum]
MRKFLIFILTGFISFLGFSQNTLDLTQEVPFDKTIRTGVLPNGLTYYIKHNEIPKDKTSFYLYQNVGAVLESDKQNGLAHFLEHMAFNGTTHFQGNSVIDWLEKKGVKFGKEINAYTSTNETVYNLSEVPTVNEKVIDSCLLILSEWCNELSLTNEEIDAERNVIQEEWRQRYNANYRLEKQLKGVKYNNSVYSKRDALGSMDVVKNFKYRALRDFYHDWYRTDLQAIGIVGDFDVDIMEEKVKALFSKIPTIKNPKERKYVTIPDNEKPLYKVATDKEVKNVGLTLEIRQFYRKDNSLAQQRENFVHTVFNSLMNARYKEAIMKGKTPFKSPRALYTDFEKNYKAFNLSLSANESEVENAFKAVYTELQRVVQHGFTQGEVDRLKSKMLQNNDIWLQRSKNSSSDSYAKSIKSAYLDGLAVPTHEFSYNFAKTIIPSISKEEVSALAKQYLTEKNRVFTITAPEKENLQVPTLKQIQSIMAEVEKSKLEPYVDQFPVDMALLDSIPEGGKIISEKLIKDFKAVEWQLSNGAKVVYKFSNAQKGHLELNAVSQGGASVYDIKDIPSLQAVSLVNRFGIGDLDPLTYSKVMADNSAKSNVSLETYNERITASASTKDIESMFQLVYMRFETPRFDEAEFNELMTGNYNSLNNAVQNPNTVMSNTYKTLVANGDPRYFEFDKAYLDQINFNRMKEIYGERFSNAGDFTFYLIGDVPFNTVKSMVEKYIGALEGEDAKETYNALDDYFPKGLNKHRVEIPMEAPRAMVVIKMEENVDYNRETIVHHNILGDILNIRFIENIREKEGGVYTISVNARDVRVPTSKLNMDISFSCDPNNAEHLNDLVYNELKQIQKDVKQSDLAKVVENLKKTRPLMTQSNSYWMATLEAYYNYDENMMAPEYYDAILDKVTTEDIKKAAQNFFNSANTLDIIFLPKAK